jgi:hypothetical protein
MIAAVVLLMSARQVCLEQNQRNTCYLQSSFTTKQPPAASGHSFTIEVRSGWYRINTEASPHSFLKHAP